jgi:hypothetical protein
MRRDLPVIPYFLGCLVGCLVWGLALAACGRAPGARRRAEESVSPARHAQSVVARLAALRLDHAKARLLLGGHRYRAVHRVSVTLDGKPDRAFEDRYELRCNPDADCYGRQDNSLEYGVEFYRIGEQTYFRHRYQRFLRFSEEPDEAGLRAERIWGAGAAIVELLGGYLVLTPAGQGTVAGRPSSRYKLSLGDGKGIPAIRSGRRSWRTRLKAMRIEGEAQLDTATGVVLAIKVTYAVSAPKGAHTVTITGDFDGSVVEAGKVQAIKPPADFAVARARPRDARDLRLLGSARLNPGWFRGGGPRAARRGRGGAGRRPASTMGAHRRRPSQPMQPMRAMQPKAMQPMRPSQPMQPMQSPRP